MTLARLASSRALPWLASAALALSAAACVGRDEDAEPAGRAIGEQARVPGSTGSNASRRPSRGDLVAHWDMETLTPSGAMAGRSGNGHDGTITHHDPVAGPIGGARQFRTVNDRVALLSSPAFDLDGPFTISARLRVDSLGLHQHVVACDDRWALWITPDDRYRLGIRGGGWSTPSGSVERARWTDVIAVLYGTAGDPLTSETAAIFIDGVRSDTEGHTRTERAADVGVWNPGELYTEDACYIGFESHQGNEAHQTMPFVGALDELMISDRAIDAPEVAALASR